MPTTMKAEKRKRTELKISTGIRNFELFQGNITSMISESVNPERMRTAVKRNSLPITHLLINQAIRKNEIHPTKTKWRYAITMDLYSSAKTAAAGMAEINCNIDFNASAKKQIEKNNFSVWAKLEFLKKFCVGAMKYHKPMICRRAARNPIILNIIEGCAQIMLRKYAGTQQPIRM